MKKNNEKYYKEFENKLNQLNNFYIETLKLYYEKMKKSYQKEIEKYSKENTFKNEYLFDIEFYEDSNYLQKWGEGIKFCYAICGILGLLAKMSLTGYIAGALTGTILGVSGGILLTPAIFIFESGKYIYKQYTESKKREEKIRFQFKFHFNNLEIKTKKSLQICLKYIL